MPSTDDNNSICSDDDKNEELEVKDKEVKEENDDEEENDDNEEGEEDDEDEDEDEDEEEDDDEEDDDEEYDPSIIQFELLKNFLVDEEGTNIATHLGSIAHELRRLNKVLLKKEK
jgi:TATA-binding protein-associated factor Taf7